MALTAELINLKSAGTYRFERDISQISNDTTTYTTLRLVVGFSKTGPFNSPQLVTNQAEFIKLFGNIDRSLERKGSYFHRSAITALSAGPILALNLVNLDPDLDQVQEISFSVNTNDVNRNIVTLPVPSFYNTDKFWYSDADAYMDSINYYLCNILDDAKGDNDSDDDNVGNTTSDEKWGDSLLHFANIGRKPMSILVKKAADTAVVNYELTLNEWFGAGNVPEYLNGTSYVSDYMVDVYVVGGDFGPAKKEPMELLTQVDMDNDFYGEKEGEVLKKYVNVDSGQNAYSRLTSDVVYKNYFDERGFIRRLSENETMDTRLTRFLNLPSVEVIAKYTGSLIPNFVDKFGRNIWIQKLVNDDTLSTGLICTINVDLLERSIDEEQEVKNEVIDLIGHNVYKKIHENMKNDDKQIVPTLNFDFLSYKFDYSQKEQSLSIYYPLNNDSSDSDDIYKEKKLFTYKRQLDATSDIDYDSTGQDVHLFAWKLDIDEKFIVDHGSIDKNTNIHMATYEDENGIQTQIPYILYTDTTILGYKTTNAYLSSKIAPNVEEGVLTTFDIAEKTNAVNLFGEHRSKLDVDGVTINNQPIYTDKYCKTKYEKVESNEAILDKGTDISVGDYIVSYYYPGILIDENGEDVYPSRESAYSRLARVVSVKNIYQKVPINDEDLKNDDILVSENYIIQKVAIRVVCSEPIHTNRGVSDNIICSVKPIDKICDRLQWFSLSGFKMRKELMPDGTNERQNQILDMLREEPEQLSTITNLYKALIDRDFIQWRYLVDTFGLGLEEHCKSVYTKLCQGRKSALALINCPSQEDFKKSIDPSFTNATKGVMVEHIATGGDLSKNPQFLFTLPEVEEGASWGAYFYPYLKISDLSTIKTAPPAAYVSNLFLQKYNRGFAWSIVAGQKRGVITGNQVVGVESTLIHENRDYLEPIGINSIIWENGVGVEIYANKTAKQSPKSALSSIHVREACIHIQDNVESILRRYVFEFNTAQTRMEIKTLVDNFMESVKNNSGVYDYKTIMDTSNNTQEVIDNNMGVIDIYIEPIRGLEIITQRLTVMKTGGIAAGSFE